jgi:hypothetical protein
MVVALYRRPPDRRLRTTAVALGATGLALGVLLGLNEGGFVGARHYAAVAEWDVVELLVLMGAMFLLLLRDRADRALWALLAAYGTSLALGIFWFVVLAQLHVAAPGHPMRWSVSVERIVFTLLMIGAAWWRLSTARRGRPPTGMIGRRAGQLAMIR